MFSSNQRRNAATRIQNNKRKKDDDEEETEEKTWLSSLRKVGNIYTQKINSSNLVTLEKLCENLAIQPVIDFPSANGRFNDTYFTRDKTSGQELAIRVSRNPVATYRSYRGEKSQGFLSVSGVGVNDKNIKQIKKAKNDYKPPDKRRIEPQKPSMYAITLSDLPNYSSLHIQEIEDGEVLIELEISERNWLESSNQGLCPPIIYYGYIIKEIPVGFMGRGVDYEIRSCIIYEKYSMDLGGFYVNIVMSDKYNEEARESINNKVLEEVRAMIRGLVDLSIICADIKPANMVVKYNTRPDGKIDVNSIKVRLIDLDGDWCKRRENRIVYNQTLRRSLRKINAAEREHKENIELLMLLVLGFHFDKYIEYNPFTAHFKDVFKQEGISPDDLHKMLREHTTISHNAIDETTDLSLLPLNETYNHYFLNRDSRKRIIPDGKGSIFKELCKRIQEPYVPPSNSMNKLRSRSRGGKKQRTLRYKMSKRKGGSTKRKTLKIRKI